MVLPHQDFCINHFCTAFRKTSAWCLGWKLYSLLSGDGFPWVDFCFPAFPKDSFCLLLVFPPDCLFPGEIAGFWFMLHSCLVRAVRALPKLVICPGDVDCRQWLLLTQGVLWGFQKQQSSSVNSSTTQAVSWGNQHPWSSPLRPSS